MGHKELISRAASGLSVTPEDVLHLEGAACDPALGVDERNEIQRALVRIDTRGLVTKTRAKPEKKAVDVEPEKKGVLSKVKDAVKSAVKAVAPEPSKQSKKLLKAIGGIKKGYEVEFETDEGFGRGVVNKVTTETVVLEVSGDPDVRVYKSSVTKVIVKKK